MLARYRSVLLTRCTILFCLFVTACPSVIDAQATPSAKSRNNVSVVPFVGCRADGQVGPIDAPNGTPKRIGVSKEEATQFAYYKAESGPGILGPRGWHCFETYGSSGLSLYLSPQPINSKAIFSDEWKGLSGHAIELSVEYGGTSGRFGVAKTIARIFPSHKAFVRRVVAEGIMPADEFPSGPYPDDKLTYKAPTIAEYLTPAQTEGLGTQSRLQKNNDPICGVVILTDLPSEPTAISLHVRLPASDSDLAPAIVR
jgi:hypothetical protein